MEQDLSVLSQLMEYKLWLDMGLYQTLDSPSYAARPDALKQGLYWLNHIHTVDQIFKCHLIGVPHGFTSTVSDTFPSLPELRKSAETLDQWLIDYANQLDSTAAAQRIDFIFTDGDQGCMSRAEMLLHLATHGLCHIISTNQLLAQDGLPVPPVLLTSRLSKLRARQ